MPSEHFSHMHLSCTAYKLTTVSRKFLPTELKAPAELLGLIISTNEKALEIEAEHNKLGLSGAERNPGMAVVYFRRTTLCHFDATDLVLPLVSRFEFYSPN